MTWLPRTGFPAEAVIWLGVRSGLRPGGGGKPSQPLVGDGQALRSYPLGQHRLAHLDPLPVRLAEDSGCGVYEPGVALVKRVRALGECGQARPRAAGNGLGLGRRIVVADGGCRWRELQGQPLAERCAPSPPPPAVSFLQPGYRGEVPVFEGETVTVAGDVPEDHAAAEQERGAGCEQPAGERYPLDADASGQAGELADQVADAFDDGDEQDGHCGVHDGGGRVAVRGGDAEVDGGGDERPRGPPQDGPGQAEIFGEQVPGEQGEDAEVDPDGDDPGEGPNQGWARSRTVVNDPIPPSTASALSSGATTAAVMMTVLLAVVC
jgi:hypothetical protein